MNKIFVLASITLLMMGCPDNHRIDYPIGVFPARVTNFEAVNSQYDDYNSNLNFIFGNYYLQFSSNRHSFGGDYDIVGRNVRLTWDQERGIFNIEAEYPFRYHPFFQPMQDSLNTSCNELGPLNMSFFDGPENYEGLMTDLMMYANDCNGNFDIKYLYAKSEYYYNVDCTFVLQPIHNLDIVNTDADELYPTFFGEDIVEPNFWNPQVQKFEKLIFCSDRSGNFDFFEADVSGDIPFLDKLASTVPLEAAPLSVNSPADDKCPWVQGNFMVFTSNRAGGYGGFDLYYSRFNNGNWETPVNFGENINTEHDEYRPIFFRVDGFSNQMMIFSSNRPGGKGGFDLYYVGTNVMNQ